MAMLIADSAQINRLGDAIAEIGGLDRADLAFVVIATDWTRTDGLQSWANSPDPSEVVALVHLWLAALTKPNLTSVPIELR